MRLWKVLGLAGLAGVAATGAVIARDRRQRSQLTPEEIRERLRARLDEGVAGEPGHSASTDSSARP
jgi:hypothetical protein